MLNVKITMASTTLSHRIDLSFEMLSYLILL